MKNSYYFSHDSNARNDPKCSALISEYGMEGYGTYWVMIELLSEQDGYRLEKFPKLYEAIAKQCSSTAEATRSTIEALLNCFKLLREDENYIWSESLLRRMKEKEKKRQIKVEAGRQGGIKSGLSRNQAKQNEAPLKQNEATLEANEPKESKVKESKVNIKDSTLCAFFESIWALYPKKEGKGSVSKTQKEKLYKIGQEEIERCVRRYIDAKQGEDKKYLKSGSTFFNSGYVDYLDKNYKEQEPAAPSAVRPMTNQIQLDPRMLAKYSAPFRKAATNDTT